MERKISKESVLAFLLLILTFSTFFLKGMYFEGEQFVYLGLLGILGIAVFLLIPAKESFGKSVDWFCLSMIIIYAISCFQALYLRNAVLETVKYSGAFLAYLLSKRVLQNRKDWFILTIYLAGVIMSLIGLGAASGLYHITGAYKQNENLVTSLFQYHNTSAIMLTCVFVFGLSLYSKASKLWVKLLIAAGNMIALLTVVFSASRGTWVLFPFILIFYYVLLPKGERRASVPVLGTILAAVLIMKGCGNALAQQNTPIVLLYLFSSVLLGVIFTYFLEKYSKKILFTKKTVVILSVIVLLVIFTLLLFGKFILPESIFQRISSFTLESRTVTERFTFYKDAFSVYKDYPILGIGGGGWPFIYLEYQSYDYLANSPHSFLLHLMVETGILGILVFLFLVVIMVRFFILLLKAKPEVKRIYAPIFISAAAMFVHSMFDFDFTYYTVIITVWMMLSLLSDLETKNREPKKKWLRYIGIFCSLLIALCGILGKIGWDSYYKTAEYMQTDNEKAYQYASKAVSIDPGNSMYAITKGNMAFHLAAAQKNETQLRIFAKQAEDAFTKAYQNNPRDHMLVRELATFYVNIGKFDEGCAMIENLIRLTPFNQDSYTRLADIYTTVAQVYQKNNDIAGMKKAMGRLANLINETTAYFEARGIRYNMNHATTNAVLQAQRILEQIEALEEK